MTVPHLDLATLQFDSMLASVTFAGLFVALWRMRREDDYLLHWALSLFLYAGVIAAFAAVSDPAPILLRAILNAILAGSTLFLVSGIRAFEGRRRFAPWMAIPPIAVVLGVVVPHAIGRPAVSHILATGGLALGMAMYGGSLLAGRDRSLGRVVVGGALLWYIPGYVLALFGETLLGSAANLVGTVALLSDQVLLLLINMALLAMRGERFTSRLRDSALTDPLTGARNRAWLAEHGWQATASGAAVVLIDIDHFKAINDSGGHGAGDAVLTAFAKATMGLCEPLSGAVVRLGGDEFLVLLPGVGRAVALAFAERVRALSASRPTGVPAWTTSLGIGFMQPGEATLAPVLARADASLYRAKAAGRDRVAA